MGFHVKFEYFKKDIIGEIDGNPLVVVVWEQSMRHNSVIVSVIVAAGMYERITTHPHSHHLRQ